MTLALITPPEQEPVTLDELKGFASVDFADDDDLLSALGMAAREFVEAVTGCAVATQTWELTARTWPADIINLPKAPLQAVESVKYRNAAGSVITLTPDQDYIAHTAGGTVEPKASWPVVGDYPDAVQVRFTVGYSDADQVPKRIKTAIMALALHWFDTRRPVEGADGATRKVPFHVKALLAQMRGGRLEAMS